MFAGFCAVDKPSINHCPVSGSFAVLSSRAHVLILICITTHRN